MWLEGSRSKEVEAHATQDARCGPVGFGAGDDRIARARYAGVRTGQQRRWERQFRPAGRQVPPAGTDDYDAPLQVAGRAAIPGSVIDSARWVRVGSSE